MTENTIRQYGEATEVPEIGQSTLLSCQHCGKIYYSKHDLTKHIEENHSPQSDAEEVMASDTNHETILFESNSEEGITLEENVEHANMEDGEILEEGELLYYVKHENIFWPAVGHASKLSPKEVMKLSLLNRSSTTVVIPCSQVKEFTPYTRVPAKRTHEWRDAYAKALKLYESLK